MTYLTPKYWLAAIVICCLPMPLRAANLALNPGFEQGFANWTGAAWNLSSDSYTGASAMQLVGAETGVGLYQDIPTVAGAWYLITFQFAGSIPGPMDSGPFEIRFGDAYADHIYSQHFAGAYRPWMTFPVWASSETSRLRFFRWGNIEEGEIRIDDVCVDLNYGSCGGSDDIPEPSAFLLVGSAVLLAFGLRATSRVKVR